MAIVAGAALLSSAAAPAAAGATLLFEASEGRVLYAEEADRPWYPASLTKMMTAYVVFDAWASGRLSPQSMVTISAYANAQPKMRLGLGAGKQITFDEAMKALIIESANDVAVAIAEAVAGSEPDFVEQMNATAYRLGMYATRYINANGLPGQGQHTTARDLAILTQALLSDYPQHLEYFSMAEAQVGKRKVVTHNSVLKGVTGGDGIKTGFTCSAGYNIVASATREGRRMIAIVLGAESRTKRALRTAQLLEYGFSMLAWKELFPANLVSSLPEEPYDRAAVREENLSKRLSDCRNPVGDYAEMEGAALASAITPPALARSAMLAALAATVPDGEVLRPTAKAKDKGRNKNAGGRKKKRAHDG